MDYLAFMAAISHSHFDYLEEILLEYTIGSYIIAAETTTQSHTETGGQHFHFLVQMSQEDYHKYSKRVFIEKFKLRGRAVKGFPRQYGKLNKIENLERMKIYTVKGGHVRSNMDETSLIQYQESSFIKEDRTNLRIELFKKLKEIKLYPWYGDVNESFSYYSGGRKNYDNLVKGIIQYFIEESKPVPSPSVIKRYIIDYVSEFTISVQERSEILIRLMDIRNPFER